MEASDGEVVSDGSGGGAGNGLESVRALHGKEDDGEALPVF